MRNRSKPKDWGTAAIDALLKSGAIRPCKAHFDIYLRSYERETERAAYAIATSAMQRGEVEDRPREDFMDFVKHTLDEAEDACFICEAAFEKGDDA